MTATALVTAAALAWMRRSHWIAATACCTAAGSILFGAWLLPATASAASRSTGTISLQDLSCPTWNDCTAVGVDADHAAVIYGTNDGGAKWTSEKVSAGTPFPQWVSCSSDADCLAEGTGIKVLQHGTREFPVFVHTSNGGRDWTTSAPDLGNPVSAPICTSPTNCVAVEQSNFVARSVDRGASWTVVPGSGLPYIDSLACVRRSTRCFVVGSTPKSLLFDASTDGTKGFSRVARLSEAPGKGGVLLACGSAQDCMLVSRNFGRMLLTTSDAGHHWSVGELPRAFRGVHALTCPTVNHCVLLGTAASHPGFLLAATTGDDGESWRLSTVARDPNPDYVASINCPSVARCFVAGPATPNGSVEIRTSSGRWMLTRVP